MSGAPETAARVTESFGRRVIVETSEGVRMPAELFGKRLTCVCGDDVRIRLPRTSGDVAKVVKVAPRRTLFARTDSRGRMEPLAANLSLIIVIVAPEPEPDLFIADRYLAGAALAGISGALIVNKSELPGAQEPEFQAAINDYERAGYPVLRISALHDEQSVEPVRSLLAGATGMLVGQSGVGKSTLTNRLAPESERATRSLSDATGEGRHTTVSTALFRLSSGGELIDSPGVRDYAPPPVEDAKVQVGWPEIVRLAPQCRFNNCLHIREPGCAVTAAVAQKEISARRYESYKRLLNIMRELAPEYERRR
jgi:ribosome biogenesis GTPase